MEASGNQKGEKKQKTKKIIEEKGGTSINRKRRPGQDMLKEESQNKGKDQTGQGVSKVDLVGQKEKKEYGLQVSNKKGKEETQQEMNMGQSPYEVGINNSPADGREGNETEKLKPLTEVEEDMIIDEPILPDLREPKLDIGLLIEREVRRLGKSRKVDEEILEDVDTQTNRD